MPRSSSFVNEFLTSLNNLVSLIKVFELAVCADFQLLVLLKVVHSLELKDNMELRILLKTFENPSLFS